MIKKKASTSLTAWLLGYFCRYFCLPYIRVRLLTPHHQTPQFFSETNRNLVIPLAQQGALQRWSSQATSRVVATLPHHASTQHRELAKLKAVRYSVKTAVRKETHSAASSSYANRPFSPNHRTHPHVQARPSPQPLSKVRMPASSPTRLSLHSRPCLTAAIVAFLSTRGIACSIFCIALPLDLMPIFTGSSSAVWPV